MVIGPTFPDTNNQRSMDSTNTPSLFVTETQTLTRFQIMDGAPIPVRLYLSGIPWDLTPMYYSPYTRSRFAVKCYLNLVLVDDG